VKRHKCRNTRPNVAKLTSGMDCSVVPMKRGNARGGGGAGHPLRNGGQLKRSNVTYGEAYTGTKSKDGYSQGGPAASRAILSEDVRPCAGSRWVAWGGTSRVTGDRLARICESSRVKFPRSTRQMHPEKSGIVYCKDSNRRKDYPRISFTFLGYEFRPRSAKTRDGKIWTSFQPAISASAMKRIRQTIREWNLPRQTSVSLNELARRYNHHIRGWMNYYSHFYKSALYQLYRHLDRKLVRWAQRKYRKLAGRPTRARQWLRKVVRRQPRLFVHWLAHGKVAVRTMGAV
jgi:hypothetical protein